jgi:hypothetical protein
VNRGARARRIPNVVGGSRFAPALIFTGTTAGGLVGGHLLAYTVFAPDAGHRQALLHQTGHGYLPRAVVVALVLSALAAGLAARLGFRHGRAAERPPQGLVRTALRLSALQASGFIALEVVERLVSGSGVGSLAGRLLAIGLAAQVAMAWLGATLLALIGRAAEEVARAVGFRPETPPPSLLSVLVPDHAVVRRSDARPGAPSRGPPALLPHSA